MDEAPPAKATFPRIFWIALGLELLERLAFYGVYVNLAVYLTETVGLSDVESGSLLGIFALVRAWVPVGTGALADRIGFRKSLTIAFVLYTFAYILLFLSPSRVGAYGAVMGMAIGGAFLKPVIPGTVRRYSAPDQRAMGFSFFYASVNLGSVVGKVATKLVRERLSLRSSMINAVIACLIGLGVTLALFHEPKKEAPALKVEASGAPDEVKKIELKEAEPERESDFLRDVLEAFTKPKLVVFLLLISGYYLLIEQFYQTFPTYIVRAFGEKAPREYITLINPAAIALLQVGVGRITKKLPA
jgi:dipeptide/tripeptide permease